MKCNLISIDLAKNVFQVCIFDEAYNIIMNKKVSRTKLLDTLRQFEAPHVVMEACYTARCWSNDRICHYRCHRRPLLFGESANERMILIFGFLGVSMYVHFWRIRYLWAPYISELVKKSFI
jgi:hypothetical protein